MSFECFVLGACLLVGPATVHDGDTIRVQGQSIRLQGVDAEELNEPNGLGAKFVMDVIVYNKTVTCYPDGKSYNRVVAKCYLPDGTDVGAQLVHYGWALDCARYSGGAYRKLEPAGARDRLIQKPYCK